MGGETMEKNDKTMGNIIKAIIVVAFLCGCLGSPPTSQSNEQASQPSPTSLNPTVPAEATTSTAAEGNSQAVDDRAICLEARANRTQYERCKTSGAGNLPMPQSELQICAEIQQNAGAYAETFFHGLQHCAGIPEGDTTGNQAENAMFCKDLGQPDRDQCYLSASMCDPIENVDIKNQCQSGQQINKV
jgi:hypothetical protein